MQGRSEVSRRRFVGGLATALGYLSVRPGADLWAGTIDSPLVPPPVAMLDEYDDFAKLANNENPYGPSKMVLEAMTRAFKYANRYGYPDGDINEVIAAHHGLKTENLILGAGSGEILNVACTSLLQGGKKIVGSDPSYSILYQRASRLESETIKIPLLEDHRQDIPALIKAATANHRDVGFVYLCNPNNPTGLVVTAAEVKQLLDGLPEGMPVMIDEAYHHFVEDPAYATSVPYVLEGRPVIVTRTFSKISGLAGMRLGYALAPRALIQRMRPYATGSVNAVVKWGGVAALKDTADMARVKSVTIELRAKTTRELKALGYESIPSEANFFMVHLRRPVQPVIAEFRKKGVLVGRPFPPMTEHLRVSIGTADEMGRFMTAFKAIVAAPASSG